MLSINQNSFNQPRPKHHYHYGHQPPPLAVLSESRLLLHAALASSNSSNVFSSAAEFIMGGRGRSRTQRKHFKHSRDNVWKRPKSEADAEAQPQQQGDDDTNKANPTWEPLTTENPAFEDYYKEQGIVPAEEWGTLMDCLKTPLPAAFRINSSSQFYMDIREQLENDFAKSLQAESIDGSELEAIKPLSWYPENLAWHSNYSRKQLRKNQTLERFHEFLKLANEIGNITRQEAVSMVPPLFLDVQPDHFVLDMCAAPGSKTFQLLEMIHHFTEPGTLPSGMVVANDVDVQRCNLLIHQTKRMCTANLIVTTNEAQQFPGCHLRRTGVNASKTGNTKDHELKQLLFDRVLCDVPCSGDGTLRKAPDIWRKWNAGMGNGLHGLQVQIAMRGLSLLKVGGKMVYSTCSMNPVENEAVVAEILRRCGGSVELVDVSAELPELVRRPGLKTWKVRDKGMWLASYRDVPKSRKGAVIPGMFPSGRAYADTTTHSHDTSTGESCDNNGVQNFENGSQLTNGAVGANNILEEEVSDLPLERCVRIVPHDQNTGAFFIAVLQKLSPLPSIQKKPVSLTGQSIRNREVYSEKVASDVKEDQEGAETDTADVKDGELQADVERIEVKGGAEQVDADLADVPDGEFPVAKSGSDFLGSVSNEAALGPERHKMPVEIEAEESQPSTNEKAGLEMVGGKRKLQIQGRWIGVDPVIFYRDDAVVGRIKEFYGIKESFPFSGHLVTRNSDTGNVKRIYYISKSVKDVLELNLLSGQQLKIASVGLKMFERQTLKEGSLSPCAFRISSEGLPLLLPHITKQILCASPVDFKHLLQYRSIKFGDFVDSEFGEKASKLMLGCCVVILNKDSSTSSDPPQVDASTIAIGCWRGRTNISVMVTALDCQELLERVSKHMEIEGFSEPEEKKASRIEIDDNGRMNDTQLREDTEAMVPATLG